MDINSIPLPPQPGQQTPAPQGQPVPAPASETKPNDLSVSQQAPAGQQQPNQTGVPENWEWDGNPNTVPDPFKKIAKEMMRAHTKRSMANADLIEAGKEYQNFQTTEDWKAFQEWKSGNRAPSVSHPPVQQQPQQPLITADEWQAAQLDPTGQKFFELTQRIADAKVNAAVNAYQSSMQQMQYQQQVNSFEKAVNDITDLHPDVVDLYEAGIFKPYLDMELNSGKHKNYASAAQAAYDNAVKVRDFYNQSATQNAQIRVAEKAGAVTLPGTSTGEADTFVVEDKRDALDKAFDFALQGKKVKVRSKK